VRNKTSADGVCGSGSVVMACESLPTAHRSRSTPNATASTVAATSTSGTGAYTASVQRRYEPSMVYGLTR
jgi:hypothetical protein